MSNTTPAGWFPDPQVPGQQRYWNGAAWTEHTAPLHHVALPTTAWQAGGADAMSAQPLSSGRRNWFRRHPIVSGIAALFLVVAAVGAASGGGDSDADKQSTVASDSKSGDEVEEHAASTTQSSPIEPTPEPVDTDGDGVTDEADFLPNDPQVRTAMDVDTDGDGVPDPNDDFPEDPNFSKDTDGDQVADRLDAFPSDARYTTDSDGDLVADSVDAFPDDPSRSEITLAMQNALDSARDYLDYTAFSRLGLIDQLSSQYGEGYKVGDATWAVDQLHEDWKAQAVLSARGYLDYDSFSRQGLIDQLSSPYGEQFTVEEATYAVDKIGL
jgi:hypothetical protein